MSPGKEKTNDGQGARKRLIRLDDLIPKGDVKGGRQLTFGAVDVNSGKTGRKRLTEQGK